MNRKQFRPKWKYPSNVKWRCMDCSATFRDHDATGWELGHARGRRWHFAFHAVTTDVNAVSFGVSLYA